MSVGVSCNFMDTCEYIMTQTMADVMPCCCTGRWYALADVIPYNIVVDGRTTEVDVITSSLAK